MLPLPFSPPTQVIITKFTLCLGLWVPGYNYNCELDLTKRPWHIVGQCYHGKIIHNTWLDLNSCNLVCNRLFFFLDTEESTSAILCAFVLSPRLDELAGANKTIKVTYGVFKGPPVPLYFNESCCSVWTQDNKNRAA